MLPFTRAVVPKYFSGFFCHSSQHYSTCKTCDDPKQSYQLLIIGGGSAGMALSAYFSRKLGPGRVGVVESSQMHSFQPLWTLVGGGLNRLDKASKPMGHLFHNNCTWIPDHLKTFVPEKNYIITQTEKEIKYDYLVVAMGITPRLDMVKGLMQALETPGVCSIYYGEGSVKTYESAKRLQKGNALFTFPSTPIKCAGAPQKIMYLTEELFRNTGRRDQYHVQYNNALGVMFSVPVYAKTMVKVAERKGIHVNYFHDLVEVDWKNRIAKFRVKSSNEDVEKIQDFPYDFLHVAPPFSAPDNLRMCTELVDSAGYLNVDPYTLQHKKYPNIFGIGDCANLPTSKTLAAITTQGKVLRRRIGALINNQDVNKQVVTLHLLFYCIQSIFKFCSHQFQILYNGYTSCPLITSHNTVVMAEFGYDGKLLETLPINQNKERHTLFYVATKLMPQIYWRLHVNGFWEGPSIFRRIFHPFQR
ncbi:Sulfide:quinone oxidoreductase, mitochondrial [Trichinella murrelli]|uniref:Sulfide:quinone oxidoreductase, mitochondrial n=1 Tax=Trichinella murrelli TaxID=144512 RepID=A0A0V0TCF8_9BILA|nr:Sulfide:quinone oxidoreductase, mitochondrial [Trichinella murrelli]